MCRLREHMVIWWARENTGAGSDSRILPEPCAARIVVEPKGTLWSYGIRMVWIWELEGQYISSTVFWEISYRSVEYPYTQCACTVVCGAGSSSLEASLGDCASQWSLVQSQSQYSAQLVWSLSLGQKAAHSRQCSRQCSDTTVVHPRTYKVWAGWGEK